MSWCAEIFNSMEVVDIVDDIPSVESLLIAHDGRKKEIEAREEVFGNVIAQGEEMIESGHHCSEEVQYHSIRQLSYTTPHHTTSHDTTPHHTIQHHTRPHHITPHYTTRHHTLPRHITQQHTTPYTTPYHTISYHIIPYHTIQYHAIPYHTTNTVYFSPSIPIVFQYLVDKRKGRVTFN